jgi:Zn-dependent protease with chaperone function
MIQADRALCEKATPEEVMGLLNKVQRLNATDTELGSVKTTVFHPIPPLSDRIRSLSK